MSNIERSIVPSPLPRAARIARHWGSLGARERQVMRFIGAGWITGASDDDPSGIATYSQAGAQFGFSMTWVMLFTWRHPRQWEFWLGGTTRALLERATMPILMAH